MKVYRSKNGETNKKVNKKMWISVGISTALIACALAIILSVSLIGKGPGIDDGGGLDVDNVPVYVMPTNSLEVGKTFSDAKLVKYFTSNWYETHEGIDFLVEAGSEVRAISDGTILSIEASTSMEGTVIKIQHADGVVSVYKGLSNQPLVREGDEVEAGDAIGAVGRMPIEAREYDEPHLHLEVFKNGASVNPLNYLPELGDK